MPSTEDNKPDKKVPNEEEVVDEDAIMEFLQAPDDTEGTAHY